MSNFDRMRDEAGEWITESENARDFIMMSAMALILIAGGVVLIFLA